MMRSATLFALALGLLVASGLPTGCSAGVVGGECRAGYIACSGRCVDQLTSAEHCGACGHACEEGVACVQGICGGNDASTGGAAGASGAGNGGSAGATGGNAGSGATAGRDGGSEPDSSFEGGTSGQGGTSGNAGRGGTSGNAGRGGTSGTAGRGGTSGTAGSAGTGGRNTAGTAGTAGRGGSAAAGGSDGGACSPPFDTAQHCGDCNTRCVEPAILCSLGNDGYFCTTRCAPPLSECGTQCVNFDTDENNCGQCGRRCASGICQGRQCVGATAGHDVLICMDYSTAAPADTAPAQLLGNAVFLPSRNPVRVLGYTEFTPPAVVTSVRTSLDAAATNHPGRTYALTNSTTSLDVANRLSVANFDVLLVYDQAQAPPGRLASAGTTMADAVSSFMRAGGVVTVLAGPGGRGEMPDFIQNAGLGPLATQEVVTGQLLYVRSFGDAIGVGVLSPFRAPRASCRFVTTAPADPATVFVVTDTPSSAGTLGAPAVVHRVITP